MKTKQLAATAILACVLGSTFLSRAQSGSLDLTFNPGSGANGLVYCMALQTNGQIVIGGSFTTFNGANRQYLARLNSDGSLDFSFDPGAGLGSWVQSLAVQPDGKILVGGNITRLRTDGSMDTGFTSITYGVDGFAVQGDGKILFNGVLSNNNSNARLNTNGTLDATFQPSVVSAWSGGNYSFGLQSNGSILVGGAISAINGMPINCLVHLNTDGSVDTNFNAGISPNSIVSSIAVTPQDKIIIGGDFTSINGYSRNCIARLNADGSVDTTFNPSLGFSGLGGAFVRSVAVQSDGKVIVGGNFSSFNGTNCVNIARLNTNGSLDLPFNAGLSAGNVMSVASQPDEKTLVSGGGATFNGVQMHGIARLNGDTSSTTLKLLNPQIYFGMNLSGVVSNAYRIEYTSDLNTPSLWTPLFNVTLQNNPQFILDTNPASGQRFYRAVQVSP